MKPTKEELDALATLKAAIKQRDALAAHIDTVEAQATVLRGQHSEAVKAVSRVGSALMELLGGKDAAK